MIPLPPRFTQENKESASISLSSKPARVLADAVKHHRDGSLDRAETLYRLLLERAGDHPDVLHLLGVIGYQTGHPAEALPLIDAAISRAGAVADYHNNRGLVLTRLQRIPEAVDSFNRAIGLNPGYADAFSNRGNAQQSIGQLEEAIGSYRQALSLQPQHAEAHNNLGNALRRRGEFLPAVEHWRRAIAIRPDYHEALTNLAGGLVAIDRLEEAIRLYEAGLRLRPNDSDSLAQLSEALRLAGRNRESLAIAQRGLAVDAQHVRLRVQAIRALAALQHFDEALEQARRLANERPGEPDAQVELGQLLEYGGEMEEAAGLWQRLLQREPHNADALAGLIAIKGDDVADDLLRNAAMQAENADAAPADRRVLHKALGDFREREGDYGDAMAHYTAANDLRTKELTVQGISFDANALAESVSRQMAVFDGAALDRLRAVGSDSAVPVFIVGMPRSGTSLCEQILASHSEVAGAGELNEIQAIVRDLPQICGDPPVGYPECVPRLTPEAAAGLSKRYLGRLRDVSPTASRIVDKHPINFRHLGLIAALFPRAAIVHCRRDPLDTCFSCYAQNFDAPISWAVRQESVGVYYREYERLMSHWQAVMPGRILDFVYEEAIGDLEPAVRRLIAHCGLPWQPQCLEFHKTRRMVRTASHRQVRQPIYNRSIGRWKSYESYLAPLRRVLAR